MAGLAKEFDGRVRFNTIWRTNAENPTANACFSVLTAPCCGTHFGEQQLLQDTNNHDLCKEGLYVQDYLFQSWDGSEAGASVKSAVSKQLFPTPGEQKPGRRNICFRSRQMAEWYASVLPSELVVLVQ